MRPTTDTSGARPDRTSPRRTPRSASRRRSRARAPGTPAVVGLPRSVVAGSSKAFGVSAWESTVGQEWLRGTWGTSMVGVARRPGGRCRGASFLRRGHAVACRACDLLVFTLESLSQRGDAKATGGPTRPRLLCWACRAPVARCASPRPVAQDGGDTRPSVTMALRCTHVARPLPWQARPRQQRRTKSRSGAPHEPSYCG